MSDIIRQWLLHQLGVAFVPDSWNSEMSPLILARLLSRFDLLSDYQVMVIETQTDEYANTLEFIRTTINTLGIALSKHDFENVVQGKESAATKLLYELYLTLHDKDKMHFLAARQVNEGMHVPMRTRFKVTRKVADEIKIPKFNNPLGLPLEDSQDIIEWHRVRLAKITEKCKESRDAYLYYIQNRQIEDSHKLHAHVGSAFEIPPVDKLCSEAKSVKLSYQELLAEEARIQQIGCIKPNPEVAKGIIKDIKKKRRKERARKELQVDFQRMLMHELWDGMIHEQDEYFKNELTKKLLKQSLYEQQMITKLLEVRQQKGIMIDNKMRMLECLKQEKEREFIASLFKENMEKETEAMRYYLERERQLELHERLYRAKLLRKAQKNYETCSAALEDIIDMSLYTSTFQNMMDEELPARKQRDLASLFIKQQPIFDVLDNVANVIQYEPNKFAPDIEEMYTSEIDRQYCLDDLRFEAYCEFYWPWEILEGEEYDMDVIHKGMNVIGFIVERLLLAKYPIKPLPPPPLIPKHPVAVCINGLQDMKYVPVLEKLLSAKKIKVIQMSDAMNYCLEVFKQESTVEYMDNVLVDETENATKEKDKVKPDKKGQKDSKSKSDKAGNKSDGPKTFEEKIVQTPRLFPCEELVLSQVGELGRHTFEVLNLGGAPNDYLMTAMFVEYLKSIIHTIEGWVLVNFPQTPIQAALLEESLTSMKIRNLSNYKSVDSIYEIVDLEDRLSDTNQLQFDQLANKRHSKLVQNPKPKEMLYYDTYLTAFIEIRSREEDNLPELYYDCFKTVESDNQLNMIYKEQGCKYTLYYSQIDFEMIKHLGKLILGDYTIPAKTSLELFTDTVDYVAAEWDNIVAGKESEAVKVGEKQTIPDKKSTKESKDSDKKEKSTDKKEKSTDKKDIGKGAKKGSAIIIEHEDKETQIPEPVEEETASDEEPMPDPQPGEDRWIYITLPIPLVFETALASLWENMELTYCTDFKSLFFRIRILLDSLIPYNTHIYKNMQKFIARPDQKQTHLHEFQIQYNAFPDDMRDDVEAKSELHMRVKEFKDTLYYMCDERMHENESERRRIINENWISNLLYEQTNIYVTFMQLEMDRCADTLQMLMDYYIAIITKMPCEERPLEKMSIRTIPLPVTLENTEEFMPYVNFVVNMMNTPSHGELDFNESPFHAIILTNYNICITNLTAYKQATLDILDNIIGIFDPKSKKGGGKSSKTSGKAESRKGLPKFLQPEAEVKDRAAELIQEYECAFLGECARVEMRLSLIKRVSFEDIEDVLGHNANCFHKIYSDIESRYLREIHSINDACTVFLLAIEGETKIQPEMIFSGDKFLIKIDSVLYEGPLPESIPPICENQDGEQFTALQLHKLVDILNNMSPTGMIPERAFIFLLQDILVHKADDGKPDMVPKLWSGLHPYKTHRFSQLLFGNTEYVDWKDFIIYNLGVPFPGENALLETRLQFRLLDPDCTQLIYEHQLAEVTFWFEYLFDPDVPEELLRLNTIRQLIIRLFKIDENRLNYVALLLSFCKDDNPLIGVCKAIELCMGKLVCWDKELGETYSESERAKKNGIEMEEEMERQDALEAANETLISAIDTTIHRTESAFLEDYSTTEDAKDEMYDSGESTYDSEVEYATVLQYLNQTTKNVCELEEEESLSSFNPSQGFVSKDPVEYSLPFDTLINVLTVALPWHAKIQSVGGCSFRERVALIYQSCLDEDFRTVFAYKFLNDPNFVELISSVYKFQIKSPVCIIKQILNE